MGAVGGCHSIAPFRECARRPGIQMHQVYEIVARTICGSRICGSRGAQWPAAARTKS